jgi:hypothetical protein
MWLCFEEKRFKCACEIFRLTPSLSLIVDQQLGRNEFAHAMGHYARAFTVDLQDLIDFLLVSAVLGDQAHAFQHAYGKTLVRESVEDHQQLPKIQPVDPQFFATPGKFGTEGDDDMWNNDDDFW